MTATRLVRLPEVKERTGLSKTEIYRRMDDGDFPKAIPLGPRAVAWSSDDIDSWIAQLIERAAAAPPGRKPSSPQALRAR